jgi:quercetin dioxygenase-like cupin family protein
MDTTLESASSSPQTLVIPPEGGKTVHAFGDSAVIKLSGEQTNGSLMVALSSSRPGEGPPPHIHHAEDEMFMVMEGKVRFLANGQWTEPLEAGTIVYTPRGRIHTFQNAGDTACRQLIIATPSGFELFFSKCAEVFAAAGAGGVLDMARILAISAEHQIEFVPPLGSAH